VRTHRSSDKLRSMLRDEPTQRLSTVVGDLTTPAGAHALVSHLNTRVQAGLDHVVSITGGRHPPAKLTQLRGGDFKETMQSKVLPHIVLAQAAMPHLKDVELSSYLIVDGRMGEECLKTDEALLCISNAAIYGVAAALRAEAGEARVAARVAELRVGAVIRRDDAGENPAFPGWRALPASGLASVICQAMQGIESGRVVRVSEDAIANAPRERRREAAMFEAGGVEASRETKQMAGVIPAKVVAVPAVIAEEQPSYYGSERYASERSGGAYRGDADVAARREARYARDEDEPQREGITGKVGGMLQSGMEKVGLASHKEA
jgi:NADP-dependent 3-hydroxy acid dehydrogenase YdfG